MRCRWLQRQWLNPRGLKRIKVGFGSIYLCVVMNYTCQIEYEVYESWSIRFHIYWIMSEVVLMPLLLMPTCFLLAVNIGF